MRDELTRIRYQLYPGYMVVAKEPMLVSGVLGSGTFLALWDAKNRFSGCCHYLYARARNRTQASGRYGDRALHHLLRCMLEQGAERSALQAHLLGGAITEHNRYGEKLRHVALEFLAEQGIRLLTEDTGGALGRKYVYNTDTGESMVLKVHRLRRQDWYPYHDSK